MVLKKTSANPYIVNWETNPPVKKITSLKQLSEIIDSGIYNKILEGLPAELSGSYALLYTTSLEEADDKNSPGTLENIKESYIKKFTYYPEPSRNTGNAAARRAAVKEYYHVVVKGPQRLFTDAATTDESTKMSFDLFKDTSFVKNIKQIALKQYCSSLPNDVGSKIKRGTGETDAGKVKKSILEYTSITDFSISTGKKNAGSLVNFQLIVAISNETKKLIKKMIAEAAAPKAFVSNSFKIKSFNFYEHVGSARFPKLENGNEYLDHFKATIKLLKIVSEKNKKLEPKQKYVMDLDSHIGEIQTYYNYLTKDKLGLSGEPKLLQNDFISKNGYINYSFTTFNPKTGKNTNVYYLHGQGTSVKKYKDSSTTSKLETENSFASKVSKTLQEKAKLNPNAPFEPPSPDYVNNFSNNFRSILYNINFIAKDYKKYGEKISVDLFVKSYLVDYLRESQLKNTPKRSTNKKIYNKGEINYKKTEDVENERELPKDLKEKIFSLVDGSFIQTTDAAFLNIVKNSDQIKSIEDVYNSVLNVVPLDEIISVAMSCCKKYLDDPIDKVRDIIIKNIRKEEIAKIMSYINSSGTMESKALQKAIAKELKSSGADFVEQEISKNLNILKDILISLFAKNNINKDLISIAIFSAIPAATQMVNQISGAAENLFDGSEDRSSSDSSVEQIADKNFTVIEKYISKYRSNIIQTINNNLGNLQGTDFSSIGVLSISDLGLGDIDLEGLGLDVFDLGSLSALGGLNFGSLGSLSNLNLNSFAKLGNLNLSDLAKVDGFGLDLNNLNFIDFIKSQEISTLVSPNANLDELVNQANNILKDATRQVNKVFDEAEKTIDEVVNQATSYLSQVSGKVNEYQKQVDEIIDKTEEILKGAGNLNNPFESVGKSIEEALEKYNSVNLTGDWAEQLKNALLDFVEEFIVNLISAILKEISKLCEGTSKSDFSNLGSNPPTLGNFPPDVTPVFPFVPNFLDEIITDNNVANDIGSYIDRPTEEIDEFIKDIPELLTISECCSLFSEDSSRLTNDLIMDKVWSGLLSLSKYNKLKNAIGSKGNLITVFAILSPFIDKEKCVATIKGLEDTKKILSKFCEPVSNEAIIGELLEKASSEVVGEIVKKDDKALEDLIENIKDLSDLANNFPPVFCGPEAELKEQKPIFADSMHPSMKYLQDKQLKNSYKTITDIFEVDILNFKTALTNNFRYWPGVNERMSKIFDNANDAAGAMNKIYGLDKNKDNDGNSVLGELPAPPADGYLENKAAETGLVAKRVRERIQRFRAGVDGAEREMQIQIPEGGEEGKVISLSTGYISNDKISLAFNFSENLYQNPSSQQSDIIPARTARLRVGNEINNVEYFTPFKNNQDYKNLTNNMFIAGPDEGGTDYDYALLSHFNNDSNSLSFFTEIVGQIITEHAEYISAQGLFKRNIFDKLKLNRKNACAPSLLFTDDIFTSVKPTSDNIQCLFGMGIVPTPPEIAKISSFVKIYLRIVTINEILKGIFVFGAYGFNALLATNEVQSLDSFYLKYLKAQIKKQMYFKTQVDEPGSIQIGFPDDVDFLKYLKIEYAANNNIKNVDSVSDNKVFNELIDSTVKTVKHRLNRILRDANVFNYDGVATPLSPSNLDQNVIDDGDSGFEEFLAQLEAEEGKAAADEKRKEFELLNFSDNISALEFVKSQMLRNLLRTDQQTSAGDEPNYGSQASTILSPPPINDINFEGSYFTVPAGYYTNKNNGRLKNGGFFLEQGYEVLHVFKDDGKSLLEDTSTRRAFSSDRSNKYSDYNKIKNALPSSMFNIVKMATGNFGQTEDFDPKYTSENFESAMLAGAGQTGDDKLFAKVLLGAGRSNIFADAYNQINLADMDKTRLQYLSLREGRLNYDQFTNEYGAIESHLEVLRGFLNVAAERTENTGTKIRLYELAGGNLYFKKLQGYTTLNMIMAVKDGSELQALYEKLSAAKSILGLDPSSDFFKSFKLGFARAVLDRKYFFKEENNDQLFFKIPLVYLIHDSPNSSGTEVYGDGPSSLNAYRTSFSNIVDNIFNAFREEGEDAFGVLESPISGPGAIFPVNIYESLSNTTSFSNLTDNLQYESILSFVSVLITETVQKQYPNLNGTFKQTLALIRTVLMPLINVSKRQEDPNFYQKGNSMDSLGIAIPDVNIDLLMLIVEMLLKTLATMCDPTWKTPWFFPGPLTPFGIVAKLLDDSDSVGSSDDPIAAMKSKQDELKNKIQDGLNCGSTDD